MQYFNEKTHIDLRAGKVYGISNINNSDCTFYYDESNNIRKFYVNNKGIFNIKLNEISKNFILGGLMRPKSDKKSDIQELYKKLKFQPTLKEIKFEHIAKSNNSLFEGYLKSPNLSIVLEWLLNSDFYVHFSNLDILYWSLVDIIDSVAPPESYHMLNELKDYLYHIAKADLESILLLISKYSYPNVELEQIDNFLKDLIWLIYKNKDCINYDPAEKENMNSFLLPHLLKILTNSFGTKVLIFIQNNVTEARVDKETQKEYECRTLLIKTFSTFYMSALERTNKANNILDNEFSVIDDINLCINDVIKQSGRIDVNYEFKDSKSDLHLQFCDVLMGIYGRYYAFLNDYSLSELLNRIRLLDREQNRCLELIVRLLQKSNDFNPVLMQNITPYYAQIKDSEVAKFYKVTD